MIDALRIFWDDLTTRWRVLLVCIAVLIVLVTISGWVDSAGSMVSRKRTERQASDALRRAAEIAADIAKREKEVRALEEKQNEKAKELDSSAADVRRDRDDYDRSVAEPRTDKPDAEQLCRELADLGYPCL